MSRSWGASVTSPVRLVKQSVRATETRLLKSYTQLFTQHRLGAHLLGRETCEFRVWAPRARKLEVQFTETDRREPMRAEADGYFATRLTGVAAGTPYLLRLDGELMLPDPASRSQSDGVHGPSRVVDLAHHWQDGAWRGVPLWKYMLYELHVGAFSKAGTFDGVIPELARLRRLGVTAVELMPVAQFPGTRNWGYDGVFPFAVQASYGGPKATTCPSLDLTSPTPTRRHGGAR
jgi:maltooligosyltrehalose trehalohydrolase